MVAKDKWTWGVYKMCLLEYSSRCITYLAHLLHQSPGLKLWRICHIHYANSPTHNRDVYVTFTTSTPQPNPWRICHIYYANSPTLNRDVYVTFTTPTPQSNPWRICHIYYTFRKMLLSLSTAHWIYSTHTTFPLNSFQEVCVKGNPVIFMVHF